MTTNTSLYRAVLDILRKDLRGEAVSVAEFNAILPVVSHEYFIQQYAQFQQTQKITDSLAPFIKTATITLTAGKGYLPADYLHLIGMPTCTQTVSLVSYTRKIDVVSRMEYSDRVADAITQPTATYPIAVIGTEDKASYIGYYSTYTPPIADFAMISVGGVQRPAITFTTAHGLETGDTITLSGGRTSGGVLTSEYDGTHRVVRYSDTVVYLPDVAYSSNPYFSLYTIYGVNIINVTPTTVTSIDITYLCKPVTPKLDYYVTDATNVRTFLSQSQTHTSATGESYPVATTAPTPPAVYTSETLEMEWQAQDRPSIMALILSKLGVTMGQREVTEFGMLTAKNNDK